MANAPRNRTIRYERPHWQEDYDGAMTLSQAVQKCLNAMPNTIDTRIDLSDNRFCETRHRSPRGSSNVLLHVAFWTERQSASTVPHSSKPTPEADLDELAPGRDYDFLDVDGSILLSDDHCLMAHGGPNVGPLRWYLFQIIARAIHQKKVSLPRAMSAFEFVNVANPDVISQFKRDPLKEIRLGIGQYHEEVMRSLGEEPNTSQRLRKAMAKVLIPESEEIRHVAQTASTLRHKLSIACASGSIQQDEDAMLAIARNLLEEPGVVFETRGGSTLTREQMIVKKGVKLDPFGKTVFHTDVWREMGLYLSELADNGILDV